MMGDFFFSSRRRHTRLQGDWSSDVCSADRAASTNQRDAENGSNALGTDGLIDSGLVGEGGLVQVVAGVDRSHVAGDRASEAGAQRQDNRHELGGTVPGRSEERRVGKEGRSRWAP